MIFFFLLFTSCAIKPDLSLNSLVLKFPMQIWLKNIGLVKVKDL